MSGRTACLYLLELNTPRESGMLFKENGSKCRLGDLGNIIVLFVIDGVAGELK